MKMGRARRTFYWISESKHSVDAPVLGKGIAPLQLLFPKVEEVFERCRPKRELARGRSVYFLDHRDFSHTGVQLEIGYIHTVSPTGAVKRRDLIWTGVLQARLGNTPMLAADEWNALNDDQIAHNWWTGKASKDPKWEWVAKEATVLSAEETPVFVRERTSLLNFNAIYHSLPEETLEPLSDDAFNPDDLFNAILPPEPKKPD